MGLGHNRPGHQNKSAPARGTRLLKMCLTFQNQARFELVKAHYVCILQGVGECMDLFLLQAMFVLISGTNIKNRPANC